MSLHVTEILYPGTSLQVQVAQQDTAASRISKWHLKTESPSWVFEVPYGKRLHVEKKNRQDRHDSNHRGTQALIKTVSRGQREHAKEVTCIADR